MSRDTGVHTAAHVSQPPLGDAPEDDVTAEDIAPRQGFLARRERTVLPIATVVAIVAVWEAFGQFGDINPLFFSYPSEIVGGLLALAEGPLLEDLRTSALEFAVGLGIAMLAIPIAMVIGSVRRLSYALDPIINGLYATPTLALTPLFVIWFGLGITSKIAVVAIMAFFPLVISTTEGVRTVDRSLLRAVKSFGANQWQTYRDVIFPSTIPFVVAGLRIAIGRAIIGVVIGEFIGATAGIGYRIRAAASVFQTSQYLAGIFILVLASVALNLALKKVEARLAPWRARQEA